LFNKHQWKNFAKGTKKQKSGNPYGKPLNCPTAKI